MLGAGYAIRKVNRHAEAGVPERAYAEIRSTLEQHLQRLPPQNGRFVAVVTDEERLLETLSQRATLQQVLDVMEQRWPYPGQRLALVRRIAFAVNSAELHDALNAIETRYGLLRSATVPAPTLPSAPVPGPSSVSVEPSLSTQPSLPRPLIAPTACRETVTAGVTEQRKIAIKILSSLTRSQWRDLALELQLTVGNVEDLERASSSCREAVRRMLEEYFNTSRLHRGDQFGTLLRAIRGLNLNMTADRLEEHLVW